jgi:hypothetical protein
MREGVEGQLSSVTLAFWFVLGRGGQAWGRQDMAVSGVVGGIQLACQLCS